jgi:hypothetical protein
MLSSTNKAKLTKKYDNKSIVLDVLTNTNKPKVAKKQGYDIIKNVNFYSTNNSIKNVNF